MKRAFITISCLTKTVSIVLMFLATTAMVTPAQTLTTLVNFDKTNGANPVTSLVLGTDGNFYGTTYGGGTNGDGTVFQVTPAGTLTPLHSFDVTDGAFPTGALVQGADGNFYGTAGTGGASSSGTVFKITTGGALTTLYSFCPQFGCPDGESPYAGLTQGSDGNFYGTATGGGANKWGTVFKITPGGTLTTLYTFCSGGCADGAAPYGGLVQGADGNFYGTTSRGSGTNLTGTVFKITTGGTLTTLYSFCSQSGCPDGSLPTAALVLGTDGNFYGTTSRGGTNNSGTVFKITSGGALTTLYSFCSQSGCADGAFPNGGLVQGADGNFYGMTSSGGTNNLGAVFEITLAGSLTTLHSFGGTDGSGPNAGLVQATNGKFYGTTQQGGSSSNCSNGCGTVFSLDLGQGGGGAVTLSRTALAFAKQVINTTSAAKTITVTNSGNVPVTFNNVATSGGFAVSANTCAGTLAVGKKCKIGVVFTPTQLGPLTGTLTITDDAANSPQTVALSGSGVLPATLSPASATYSKRTVGTTSAAKTFTLTNNQTIALTSIAISTTGDFAVSTTTCAASLAAKSKCTISVTFTPQATGTRTGQLSVSDSASNSPQTSSLTGTGK